MSHPLQALRAAWRRLLPRRGPPGEPPSPLRRVFTDIYLRNGWQNAESRSGPGSTVARTAGLRPQLAELVRRLGVRTFLDAPCGDFNWMKEVALPVRRYVGVDVVAELIEQARRAHAAPGREFLCLDITTDPLPRADLIFCRDALVHLPFADVFRAFARFRQSRSRYLLTTTFTGRPANEDVSPGGWRPLNLRKAPFHLPAPLATLSDGCPLPEYADKALGLWRVDQLPG
jgi:SAM-dependent methyltransferase